MYARRKTQRASPCGGERVLLLPQLSRHSNSKSRLRPTPPIRALEMDALKATWDSVSQGEKVRPPDAAESTSAGMSAGLYREVQRGLPA